MVAEAVMDALTWLIILLFAGAIFTAGCMVGTFFAIKDLPRMIAKMTPAEVDALADRVAELRGD
jgi:uncharacterized protein YneF (UPF0154 family)